jgi:hypothetical protein
MHSCQMHDGKVRILKPCAYCAHIMRTLCAHCAHIMRIKCAHENERHYLFAHCMSAMLPFKPVPSPPQFQSCRRINNTMKVLCMHACSLVECSSSRMHADGWARRVRVELLMLYMCMHMHSLAAVTRCFPHGRGAMCLDGTRFFTSPRCHIHD